MSHTRDSGQLGRCRLSSISGRSWSLFGGAKLEPIQGTLLSDSMVREPTKPRVLPEIEVSSSFLLWLENWRRTSLDSVRCAFSNLAAGILGLRFSSDSVISSSARYNWQDLVVYDRQAGGRGEDRGS